MLCAALCCSNAWVALPHVASSLWDVFWRLPALPPLRTASTDLCIHSNFHLATPASLRAAHPTRQLARLLDSHRDEYDAFLIAHGTDTMAYTASALSLMLAGFRKPIVMTGSQLPLALPRSDVRGSQAARPGAVPPVTWGPAPCCSGSCTCLCLLPGVALLAQLYHACSASRRLQATCPLPAVRRPGRTCWTACAAPPPPSARRTSTCKRWPSALAAA